MSGSGTARVVLRDASGRETVTNLPFYVSFKMLAPGLFDFSLEAGMRGSPMAPPATRTLRDLLRQEAAAGASRIGSPSKAMPKAVPGC